MSLSHLMSQRGMSSASSPVGTPIFSLPSEILGFVFEECIAQAHAHNGKGWQFHFCDRRCLLDWVQITYVCSHWRSVSTALPRLWSHVVFIIAEWAQTMLNRAGASPLVVSARFDKPDGHPELLAILLKNVDRIQDLHFEGLEEARQQLTQHLDAAVRRSDTVALKSLALLSPPRMRVLSLPSSMPHADRIKKLFLRGFALTDAAFSFEGMTALEELWLEDCPRWVTIQDRDLYLPNLTHLHLADNPDYCREFLAAFKQSRPLHYFGLEIRDLGEPFFADTSINWPHCVDMPSARDFSECNLNSALRIGLDGGCMETESEFTLVAWPREIASPSQIVSWARQGIIPPLPFDTARWSYDSRRLNSDETLEINSSFAGTNPCLYISSFLEGYYELKVDCLPMLSKAFMLRDVVFASISNYLFPYPRKEGVFEMLRTMPSLHVLEGRCVVPALLTIALTPRDGYVPVPTLSEIWLFKMLNHFQVDGNGEHEDEYASHLSAPTLSACLASRARAGSTLVKLCLTECDPLDTIERETILGLGIEIVVT